MPYVPPWRSIFLREWTLAFVPFGLLLSLALLLPELLTPGGIPNFHFLDEPLGLDDPAARDVPPGTLCITLYRAILCIWLSVLLLIPAVSLYVARGNSAALQHYALLFWTCSWLAYLAHFWFTAFVIFGGVAGTFEHMRPAIAGTNFALTAWWTFDVIIAWCVSQQHLWVRVERAGAHVFVFGVYVVTTLFLRPTFVRYLGIALVACTLLALLVRYGRPAGTVVDSRVKT